MINSLLKCKTPLRRFTPLRARTPLRKVSEKQVKINRHNASFKANRLIEQRETRGCNYCELCGQRKYQGQLELIHRTGKGRGGSATDPANLCLGCRDCHTGPKLGDHYNIRRE